MVWLLFNKLQFKRHRGTAWGRYGDEGVGYGEEGVRYGVWEEGGGWEVVGLLGHVNHFHFRSHQGSKGALILS